MKYDLHIHTYHSACSVLRPRHIFKVARKMKLDGIAITDHNTVKGGAETSKENKNRDFEVIPGIEVNTDRGHVIGLYVNEDIRSREFLAVVDEIRGQGGIVVIAHPFRMFPGQRLRYEGIVLSKCLNAVECYNARTSYFANRSAMKLAERLGLAKVGGSDAHFSFEIGRSVTLFDDDLISSIRRNATRVQGSNVTGLAGTTFSFFKKYLLRWW